MNRKPNTHEITLVKSKDELDCEECEKDILRGEEFIRLTIKNFDKKIIKQLNLHKGCIYKL